MEILLATLCVFLALSVAQLVLAPRFVDFIHGGPGRREPRRRAWDILVVRLAGGFVAVFAVLALAFVVFVLMRPV
ncbi:MAG: hypothetical protein FJ033_00745 [Chloroflexi bacterium]|nr:hypothetical protein [Chloroflexota bacterium]